MYFFVICICVFILNLKARPEGASPAVQLSARDADTSISVRIYVSFVIRFLVVFVFVYIE